MRVCMCGGGNAPTIEYMGTDVRPFIVIDNSSVIDATNYTPAYLHFFCEIINNKKKP